jgi:hypothetical protein
MSSASSVKKNFLEGQDTIQKKKRQPKGKLVQYLGN